MNSSSTLRTSPVVMRSSNDGMRSLPEEGESLDMLSSSGALNTESHYRTFTLHRRKGPRNLKLAAGVVGGCVLLILVTSLVVSLQARAKSAWGQPVKFLVVGDWGRGGNSNQTMVANIMAQQAKSLGIDFVISTGDNFYCADAECLLPGGSISGVNDPAFGRTFTSVYHHKSLDVPWHAVLGNHDYGDGHNASVEASQNCSATSSVLDCEGICCYSPLWQLDPDLLDLDARWHCERLYDMTLADGRVYILFIDTNPLVPDYLNRTWAHRPGGLHGQNPQALLRELESRLKRNSQAPWRLVVGHHAVRGTATHSLEAQEGPVVRQQLVPILSKYQVHAYFNGHDHVLEHFKQPDEFTHYITSGAGSDPRVEFPGCSAATGGNRKTCARGGSSSFRLGDSGFVAVKIGADEMRVEFLGKSNTSALHSVVIPREADAEDRRRLREF